MDFVSQRGGGGTAYIYKVAGSASDVFCLATSKDLSQISYTERESESRGCDDDDYSEPLLYYCSTARVLDNFFAPGK